jgi:hypothetical protein
MASIQTLGDFVQNAHTLPWQFAVFLAGRPPFGAETRGAVLDPDECDPDQDPPLPEFARENGFACTLPVQTLQDICENARMQRGSCLTVDDLIVAFNFYVANDAFIDF